MDVYEDDDDEIHDHDFDDDEERESTTDADEDEDEGGEQNALSDFGDWHGVQDGNAAGQNHHVDVDLDDEGEMSDSPSEYPSTQPKAQQKAGSKEGLYERRTKGRTGPGLGFRIHVDEEGV